MKIDTRIEKLFSDDIPFEYNTPEYIDQKEYLIDGKICKWDGPMEKVYSPICEFLNGEITQKIIGEYPLLTKKESTKALESATAAFDNGRGIWTTMSVEKRIEHLNTFINQMVKRKDEIVKFLMWEIGKSLKDSENEFDRTVDYIIDTIEALKNLDRDNSRLVIEKGIIGQIRRAPLGIVLCLGPFNYPLNETFATLIPALIMGNVVIFKPPKLGVLLYKPLLEAFRLSFPRGVVSIIYGDGEEVITPLMTSGKINALAFVGSSKVADILKKNHPLPHRLRSILGLEAKNAAIILPDAEIDNAVNETVLGSLSFNGQRCTALKIIFCHSDVVDEFLEKLSLKINGLKIGMPWDEDVKITPLPENNKSEYLTSLIEDALEKGANVINEMGGTVNGTFFYPALIYPVNSKMRVYHEEQFGPVVPVLSYDSLEEPLNYIVESNYGQQVSIFGTNSDNISDLIDPLINQVSRVNINSQCQRGPDTFPFTGRKDSAEGTLSVFDALRAFTIRSLVATKEIDSNKKIFREILKYNKSTFLSTDFIL
ncbi:MAG: NADP-dependent glyceraldehyde-3-phosphate dehydrogenase [Deltaproteobacteria bacterium]|nr:NADP-dependent glyceraldehyde-3-phosphate dehydrogenase [Deltaproteobacteria bacterium]